MKSIRNPLKPILGSLPFGRRPPPEQVVLPARGAGLGTFEGVFTPSILTILGVIMYLRFGWVVGNVGLAETVVIVTLSTGITFLTGLSIAAIATDQRVRVGGAYYMISRSLGVETGGAVGIPLYFAQTLSVSLYTIGFAESLVAVFPVLNEKLVGIVTAVLLALLALKSAKLAIRAQYFIMVGIGVSLVSLFLGRPLEGDLTAAWDSTRLPTVGFWNVFAVFFPAVTGIMAGVNMSGDLKDPGRSIPRGTLAAIGVSFLIYLAVPVVLVGRADPVSLVEDPLIMRRISFWGDAILIGVWGATLSSAVGSILGAPRVLQALARDGVLPGPLRWLGRGSGSTDEPRAGTAGTLVIAVAAIYLGNLNLIAPVLTMFFLTTYGVLNIAAGLERFLGSPSFRPKFRVHWIFSLLGAFGCLAVMFLINSLATVVAVIVVAGVYLWIERQELKTAWGDVRRGIWMALVRAGLFRLGAPDPKNWRPHLLVLSGAPTRRWHLIDLATSLSHGRGLITVSSVLPGRGIHLSRQRSMERALQEYLVKRGVHALVRLARSSDPFAGAERLLEAYGIGPLFPNTVILGDSEEPDHRDAYCKLIRRIHQLRRNLLIVHDQPERGFGERRKIDVWWGGLKRNGGLMITLAYLLRTSLPWRNAEVRIKMIVRDAAAVRGASSNLQNLLYKSRTGVIPEVLVSSGRSFREVLVESSGSTDLVLLGMKEPGEDYRHYYEGLRNLVETMPTTLFVLAAEDLQFGQILVEPRE